MFTKEKKEDVIAYPVPYFSRKVTLLLIPTVAIRGTTTLEDKRSVNV